MVTPGKGVSTVQAPPTRSRLSSTSTRLPARARYAAHASPLCPAPTMTTSHARAARSATGAGKPISPNTAAVGEAVLGCMTRLDHRFEECSSATVYVRSGGFIVAWEREKRTRRTPRTLRYATASVANLCVLRDLRVLFRSGRDESSPVGRQSRPEVQPGQKCRARHNTDNALGPGESFNAKPVRTPAIREDHVLDRHVSERVERWNGSK